MDSYQILVYLLFALAAIDLVVGVSNDAVNFLNSAVGSKVASFRTILIIASLGILVGTTFSSGMMEVARKGIFNPEFFTFDKIMILFLAVMLTDIILLDLYNSLGLPTSTTVSIVFELLGAAFIVGILTANDRGLSLTNFDSFLNFSSAIKIISGIFLSVFIAFATGSLIQYFIRLAFSFDLHKSLPKWGSVFSGLAITAITYFLIIKGAKGSSIISKETTEWILEHTLVIILASFVFWGIIVQILMSAFKINPLKVIVLMGTFALAMAFAGNDLVNFIGVSVAGFISHNAWLESGVPANEFFMTALTEKVATPNILLLGSGAIMVVTLWFSAKAKKVTETEVSLGRQDDGDENFRSNAFSRFLVGGVMRISEGVSSALPSSMLTKVEGRFSKRSLKNIDDADAPAFDLVRASVNLVVASILISYATSQKMPLSTTYVSFMVAMGTSLSDRAWGRESAVYRVAGVINVILGWLMTAVIAFFASAIFGLILYQTGMAGVFIVAVFAAFMLVRSHITFKRKSKEEEETKAMFSKAISDIREVVTESKINTTRNLRSVRKVTALSIKSLIGQNRDVLLRSQDEIKKLRKQSEKLEGKIIKYVKKMDEGELEAGRTYLLVFDLMQDLYQSASLISESCTNHVLNHHSLPNREFIDTLIELERRTSAYIDKVVRSIENIELEKNQDIRDQKDQLVQFINESLDKQIIEIQKGHLSNRLASLQTRI
ncbi:MAG: inorganic phosphate transporter, partial [Bacteroidota bacterium]|nr:inorganic phosphate transporter [Bacteroidota bacterium]